jgi:hypothetical protein
MVLDGLQTAIFEGLHGNVNDIDYADGNMIYFAADSIITARTRESAEKILEILSAFLASCGLRLSPTQRRIYAISKGFDFASCNYRYDYLTWGHPKSRGVLYSAPSVLPVRRSKESLAGLIVNSD